MHILVKDKRTGVEQTIKLEEAAELMGLAADEIEWALEEYPRDCSRTPPIHLASALRGISSRRANNSKPAYGAQARHTRSGCHRDKVHLRHPSKTSLRNDRSGPQADRQLLASRTK